MPTRALPEAIAEQIASLPANQYSSKMVLPTLRGDDMWILLRVRRVGDYSLTPMGIMAVAVNLQRLSRIYGRVPIQAETHLKIYANDRLIYETPDAPQLPVQYRTMVSPAGYSVEEIGNTRYLMADTRSTNPSFHYLYMVPVGSVLSGVTIGGLILVLTMLTLASIAVAAGYWISRKITEPIEQLRMQLDRIGEGKFEPIALEDTKWSGNDEIGAFYRDFQIMVGKIDTLLNENYARRIESQEARLQALEAQVSPHFLYNTLDTISWLAASGKTEHVSTMARSLGNLLRATLGQTGNETTLADELDHLDDYIAIQSLRFGDRLRFAQSVPVDLLPSRIPSLILQPLVENSIHYGVEKKRNGCTIQVTAHAIAGRIQVIVHDDGIGMTDELQREIIEGTVKTSSTGIGIANIQKRLHILYGEDAWLKFESVPDCGTTAQLHLPLVTSQSNALTGEPRT
jgi:two-component system, sensor histidine kinase YesM